MSTSFSNAETNIVEKMCIATFKSYIFLCKNFITLYTNDYRLIFFNFLYINVSQSFPPKHHLRDKRNARGLQHIKLEIE